MTSGNGLPTASECDEALGVRGLGPRGRQSHPSELDSQPLRDIENIIAKLKVVNRQLWTRKLTGRPTSPWPSREADGPSPQE